MSKSEVVLRELRKVIPVPETELRHGNPFQLLIAVILSAQCTDERVNKVTPKLFGAFPDAASMAKASPQEVFPFIASVSYPNNKSKHLVGTASRIMDAYSGSVPEKETELVTLAGVGRKTAQVVQSVAFGKAALAVDTHVFRVANRIGLVDEKATTPEKVEKQLKRRFPRDQWGDAHHLLILHGRYTCTARSPKCTECPLTSICKTYERIQRLPAPVGGLEPSRGAYWCGTRKHYFDDPGHVSDRYGMEQVSCPRCGSMNVFHAKTGQTMKRVRDYRV